MFRRMLVLLLMFVGGIVAACSMANIGAMRNSSEVTQQFEKLEARPNYRYWYLNQENSPYAVVGIEREYRLDDNPMWQAVAADSTTFRKVVGLVQSFPLPNSYTSGFAIMDPQGRQIGVWYSSLTAGITVDPQTKIVSISTMMPWVFNDDL